MSTLRTTKGLRCRQKEREKEREKEKERDKDREKTREDKKIMGKHVAAIDGCRHPLMTFSSTCEVITVVHVDEFLPITELCDVLVSGAILKSNLGEAHNHICSAGFRV
jgi:hypothetical protein